MRPWYVSFSASVQCSVFTVSPYFSRPFSLSHSSMFQSIFRATKTTINLQFKFVWTQYIIWIPFFLIPLSDANEQQRNSRKKCRCYFAIELEEKKRGHLLQAPTSTKLSKREINRFVQFRLTGEGQKRKWKKICFLVLGVVVIVVVVAAACRYCIWSANHQYIEVNSGGLSAVNI